LILLQNQEFLVIFPKMKRVISARSTWKLIMGHVGNMPSNPSRATYSLLSGKGKFDSGSIFNGGQCDGDYTRERSTITHQVSN
jgi:hypothetical protein